ncbi:MAG: hypothetical protein EXS08_11715 [Planctomycetes bacterium]|nr:hypothetical protein [Planctomycetota bacterium]
MRRVALALLGALLGGCLVQHAPPAAPGPSSAHERRRSTFPDGSLRREAEVLVWSDGRIERDGLEREYSATGTLVAESHFEHGVSVGLARTWFDDGRPRSEVDFGTRAAPLLTPNRFWHANGKLAAEGPALAGVREGLWHYWNEDGSPAREGGYRSGKRDGAWTFYDEKGVKRAAGLYALGQRVGTWTLWDEHGEAHERSAAEVREPPGP